MYESNHARIDNQTIKAEHAKQLSIWRPLRPNSNSGSAAGRKPLNPPYPPDTWRAEINTVPTCISGEFTSPFPSTGPGTAVNPPATMVFESLGFSRDAPRALLGVPSGPQSCSKDAWRFSKTSMGCLLHLNAWPKMTSAIQGPSQDD